jgi:uncharacterized protein (DUF1330 family)
MPSAGKRSSEMSTLLSLRMSAAFASLRCAHSTCSNKSQAKGSVTMKQYLSLGMAMLTGIAIGGTAVGALHAQSKPKAYLVTELQVLDAAATAAYGPKVQATQKAAGGRVLNTAGGRVTSLEGAPPAQRVAITEWDSLEQAQVWNSSAARKNLLPERDKAEKLIRAYVVEAVN